MSDTTGINPPSLEAALDIPKGSLAKFVENTTDTPITDRTMSYCFGSDTEYVTKDFARYLERQLAEAKEEIQQLEIRHAATMLHTQSIVDDANKAIDQRDRLAEALRNISRQRASRYESTVGVVCNIADKALATLERKEDAFSR